MLIRFYCKRCKQLLGIASQKAGVEINCPRCGHIQFAAQEKQPLVEGGGGIVEGGPKPEGAFRFSQLTGQLTDQRIADVVVDPEFQGEPAAKDSLAPDEVVEVDCVTPLDESPSSDSGAGIANPEAGAEPAAERRDVAAGVSRDEGSSRIQQREPEPLVSSAAGHSSSLVPSDMILFPRRMLYVQAILYPAVAVVALVAGYFIGRGGATDAARSGQKAAAGDRVPVEGKVVYDPGTGIPVGDEGAVVIVLPSGKVPTSRLLAEAIRPSDSPLPESHRTLSMIRDLGGGYARADASGQFSFFLPDRGKYRVLVVSRHATRPRAAKVGETDQTEMGKYFEQPSQLLRDCKYRWTSETIDLGMKPVDVDFGKDGQE